MKLHIPFFVVVVCLVSAPFSVAQESKNGPATGKILLLRNGSVMQGDIRQTSTQVFVRDGASEIGVSAQLVLRICSDWDDAYAFVQTLIKGDNPDDRLDLARWCERYGLKDKALEQARKALELRPTHQEAKRFVGLLEIQMRETVKQPALPLAHSPQGPQTKETVPEVDVSSETLVGFVTKVQPILMNTCASCHCTNRGGNFHLERVHAATQKDATQKNLAAILTYIDFERPAISPLLVKAVMRHGKAQQAPIKDRDALAFLSLQDWIVQTLANNRHLKDYEAAKKPPIPRGPETPFATAKLTTSLENSPSGQRSGRPKAEPKSSMPPGGDVPPKENPPRLLPSTVTQTPAAVPVEDVVDPEIFNRVYHPQR